MEKKENRSLRAWEIAALMALSLFLCAGTWAQASQQSISSALVRLHVIAVSDDEEEQEIKLQVRDAVLAYLTPVLEDAGSSQAARQIISEHMDDIAQAASLAAQGRQVSVTLSRESYPTREYEGFTLPAGRYESLRVILGEGEGHNWWCVVFPPLCLTAVQAEAMQSAMSEENLSIVTEEDGYELRFRLIELWGELMNALS